MLHQPIYTTICKHASFILCQQNNHFQKLRVTAILSQLYMHVNTMYTFVNELFCINVVDLETTEPPEPTEAPEPATGGEGVEAGTGGAEAGGAEAGGTEAGTGGTEAGGAEAGTAGAEAGSP